MYSFRSKRRSAAAFALIPLAAAIGAATIAEAPAASESARLDASKNRVGPNGKVTLVGRFEQRPRPAGAMPGSPPPDARQGVTIQFRPFDRKRWREGARTRTGEKGKFRKRVPVKRSGRFRAVSSDGRVTSPEKIRVKSKTRARVTRKDVKIGQKVPIKGRVAPGGPPRRVTVKVAGDKLRTKTNRKGRFKVRWKSDDTGRHRVRVKSRSDRIAAGSRKRAGKVTVYRPARASWYGPGFYGNRTACGQTLKRSTIGVAHKTMPCGTKLTLRYRGKNVRVRVIDRGPYAHGREFDLTERTKKKLGFGSTGTVLSSR